MNRLWTVAVLVLALVNVGLFVAVLMRDDDASTSQGTIAAASPTPTTTTTQTQTRTRTPFPSLASDTIVLTRRTFVARPFRVVRVAGTWHSAGAQVRRTVHLEVRRRAGWSTFPLPAVTDPSGRFTAFVNLGAPGSYRLRVVADAGGPVSDPVTVTVR